MLKKNIAVIGACCSRDMFNHNFVPNYKDFFNLQYYAFQTSFVSLMANQIPYNTHLLNYKYENFSGWYRDILQRELEKNFCNDLLSIHPSNLLIDFYSDVYNGVIEIQNGKSYLSNRLKDMENNIAFELIPYTRKLAPISDKEEYYLLFKKSLKKFFDFMKTFLPQTKIIVNYPIFSDVVRNKDGTNEKIEIQNGVESYNKIYQDFVEYAKDICNDITVIKMDNYLIDPDYIFGGKWCVHYTLDFYTDLIRLVYNSALTSFEYNEEVSYNLIINHDFYNKTLFYKYWSDLFTIDENNSELNVCQEKNDSDIWQTIWTSDISVQTNIQYDLQFDFFADSNIKLSDKTIIAIVRVYDKQNVILKKDSIHQFEVCFNGVYDEWTSYKKIITVPSGKYLSVGLCCMRNGIMKWKNISFNRRFQNAAYSLKNITEILGVEKNRMIDINKIKIFDSY